MGAVPRFVARPPRSWVPPLAVTEAVRATVSRLSAIRVIVVANLFCLTLYIAWRGVFTLNWAAWPLSLALYGAELFSYVDTLLFCLGVWRLRLRGEPPPAPPDVTVDVFVTCYNEPVELIRATARAARAIRHRHETFVLDDGNRAEVQRMAAEEGVGYLTRGPAWQGKERHAKAGNLINALLATSGQFILVLDADQVPRPEILDRTLGYFDDPLVAFVQTPQWFRNTAEGDPFGADAPLFYGPILQGKDGWNAAFFCGSNAVLRRDALMLAGLANYAREVDLRVRNALKRAERALRTAARSLRPEAHGAWTALRAAGVAARDARARLRAGDRLQEVTWDFQHGLRAAAWATVRRDCADIDAALAETPGVPAGVGVADEAVAFLAARDRSPIVAIPELRELLREIDLDRSDQAEPVEPLATTSVTEDMATAVRLHALGYRSVYHHEVLAVGLGPEDLASMLQQRLRWAQGTMQVMLRESPLTRPGLTLVQRLLYFSTMWSYLSGFATVVYLVAPVLYLLFGWLPVDADSGDFLRMLVPCLVLNQLLFAVVAWGMPTWRGRQYSLALFPLWITAAVTAVRNVYFGARLAFVVTPKFRQAGSHWGLIRVQLAVMALLLVAIGKAVGDLCLGEGEPLPIAINIAWATYGLVLLSAVVRAARWNPPPMEQPS